MAPEEVITIIGQECGITVTFATAGVIYCPNAPIRLPRPHGLLPPCPRRVWPHRPRYSSIVFEEPAVATREPATQQDNGDAPIVGLFSISAEHSSGFSFAAEDTVVVPDAGAAESLVCFQWLKNRNCLLKRFRSPAVETYPARA